MSIKSDAVNALRKLAREPNQHGNRSAAHRAMLQLYLARPDDWLRGMVLALEKPGWCSPDAMTQWAGDVERRAS